MGERPTRPMGGAMALDEAGVIEQAVRHLRETRSERISRTAPVVPTPMPARRRGDHPGQPMPARRRGDRPGQRHPAAVRTSRPWLLVLSNCISVLAGAGVTFLALNGLRPTPVAALVAPVSAEHAVDSHLAPQDVVTAKVAASVPTAATADSPAVASPRAPDSQAEASSFVERWRSAWSSRDIEQYLASYSASFVSRHGESRDAWAEGRRTNFASRSRIAVTVRDLAVEADGDERLAVHFLQDYASGVYREIGQWKTLILQREPAGWRIVAETQAGREPPAGK